MINAMHILIILLSQCGIFINHTFIIIAHDGILPLKNIQAILLINEIIVFKKNICPSHNTEFGIFDLGFVILPCWKCTFEAYNNEVYHKKKQVVDLYCICDYIPYF